MRTLATLMFVSLSVSPLRAAQDPDHLHIDEISETFLKQWAAAEESRNAKELLDLYAVAHDTLARKLARPEPEVDRWIPLGRVLAAKLAALPGASLEPHEIIARQVLETVLEPSERRRAIEKYAYTRAGRDALDLLSNIECDAGRLTEALKGWSRTLEVRPGVETVARLAFVHSMRKDGVSLAALRAQAETRSIKGEITVEGRKRELYEYLDSLNPARGEPPPLLKPRPGPTSEIPLGHYDLREDGRYGERLAVSLPAAGRVGTKDLIVLSNGLRVIAINPARAEGGVIDEAVEWRWPKERPVRTWTLGNYNTALPFVGATVADGRVFCPMFAERQEARQQVGRRQQKFLGASVLRAVSLETGEVLWDTETVKVPVNGGTVPLLEHLRLDNSDFCFGGPPLVRGDRLYAAVMTSPFTGRQCWALCLDARTGQPLWCTDLGTAPQTKEMSVAQIAEEDGTLVFSTNYGVVAALDSRTGHFEWLVKYMGTRPKRSQHRTAGSPPVIAGSLVYVLAQDCDELLAFDRWTGIEAPLPKHSQDLSASWKDIVHLIGGAGDWLAFSGARNLALRPLDGQVVLLPDSEAPRFGRGAIAGGRLYLPTRNELAIFDTTTWKLTDQLKWETSNAGNLMVAGPLLVHLSDRLDVYTSPDLLQERFAATVDAAAPAPQECRQLARILESSGRLKECVRYYRRALKAWESDPAWQETAEALKKKLADLAAKLGDDFPRDQ
jgi:outer membrane protein assembly factor BamB